MDEQSSNSNFNNKQRSSYLVSDSNGTYRGPIFIYPSYSMTYLTSGHLFPSQTFKSFIKGPEYFDSETGIKNNSFVQNNDYYPEQNRDMKKTKGDEKGQYTYTSIPGIPDGEITAFIRNEIALNEKNNFIHTPTAGVLF